MEFHLDQACEFLARTPLTLSGLLDGLDPAWDAHTEGPGAWSPREVVGHLIHGEETDWMPRARIILADGAGRPFEPFDRFAQLTRFRDWPLAALLERFGELRAGNVETLRSWNLTPQQLALPGRHPELGPVTLAQLLATWVVHDLNHIAQIARVMAKRYAADVGPWAAYLSILGRGA